MCGIAGIFNWVPNETVEHLRVNAMVEALHHRGPDANGTYFDQSVGLGHTRLAILDLIPESNQPFISSCGQYVIVYNGEVFNYIEIRQTLESLGHTFRTQSDTEVVLNAYIEWGENAVERFNGMWALVVYDQARQIMFCSRDRFGIKPFCYSVENNEFVFGSEIKAILAASPELAKPDFDGLSQLLRTSVIDNSTTTFKSIKRLPPAHNATVLKDGSITIKRYWDYPEDDNRDISSSESTAKFRRLFEDAISIRLRSDVPIGITLSSGLDSTAIATLARQQSDRSIQTFTYKHEGIFSEWDIAQETSKRLEMQATPITCLDGDFLKELKKIIRHLESPHASPAILPVWQIMEKARADGRPVILEGQGADELLGGYEAMSFSFAIMDHLFALRPLQALKELYGNIRRQRQCPSISNAGIVAWMVRGLLPSLHPLYRIFRGDEAVYIGKLKSAGGGRNVTKRKFKDRLNRSLAQSHESTLVSLLQYGDAISMAHSIESRLPFMDFRLVEYCFSLPGELKFKNGWGKEILRRSVEQDVPAKICRNQYKIGFVTPVSKWFRDYPELTIEPVLFSQKCQDRQIFDTKKIRVFVDQHVSGKKDRSNHIFRWVTTELWFQEFIDDNPNQ
ncbi:asparagine synthase (glutamine-hydrolyzing) [bacterium]|nr:asparagine synthase (glutamine-hydrolyzing) [bacterium]